jgi:ribosome-associated translation inhibitor RaiA
VEDRLTFALARFSERIAKVVVCFSGAPDIRGTADKRCQIDVDIRPQAVHVEDNDADLLTALNRAASRLARSVARVVERDRE